ncbi:MAG TPA: YraN family protein [Alphaproteobacteria bacterium]|nr:YraN family protein [Alphaproteobacteria bacterium]
MRRAPDLRRIRAYLRGLNAEFLSVWFLRLKGYRIMARRYRGPAGEIDIIARRGGLIAAIEVKARPSLDEALESISPRQQRRIARTLLHFQARHPRMAGFDYRFDVIWVGPRHLPRHILDAWRV